MDALLVIALALLGGAALSLAFWPSIVAAVAISFALRAHMSKRALLAAWIAFAVSGARAEMALRRAERAHEAAVLLLTPPSICEAAAIVIASPAGVHRRARVRLTEGSCDGRPITDSITADLHDVPDDLARGDALRVITQLAAAQLLHDTQLASPLPKIAQGGAVASGAALHVSVEARGSSVGAIVDRARNAVRSRIEATYHPEARALGRALVLGETDLDEEDDRAFRASGLSHLLAVSGTHLVIAVLSVVAALRAILVRVEALATRIDPGRIAAAIAVPLAWLYADFAGGSGSAVRAALMIAVVMLARAFDRRPSSARAFAWACAAPAIADPLAICDLSFVLSLGATAGLLVLGPTLTKLFDRGPNLARPIGKGLAQTLAAMAGSAPALLAIAPGVPALGLAANLVAAPIGELAALPLCLLHAAIAFVPAIERGTAIAASGALLSVRAVARWTATTGPTIPLPPPTAWQLATIAATIAFAWSIHASIPGRSRVSMRAVIAAGAIVIAAGEMVARLEGSPRGVLRVTALDVAQGDSILIDFPDGRAMLIDGGGMVGSPLDLGARVILPALRARRRSRVDVAVLSHPHPDHFMGLATSLPSLDVGELWDSGQGEDQGAGPIYAKLLAGLRSRRVPVVRPRDLCGSPRWFGGARVEVIAPCPGYHPDTGANDNSIVIAITYKNRRVLLMGDAEHEEERALVDAHGSALRADLLKVGHHGSRTSTTPAFVARVRPSFAIISSGVRNRFGHPREETLDTLARAGAIALRTDRGGAVVWETDGDRVTVTRPR